METTSTVPPRADEFSLRRETPKGADEVGAVQVAARFAGADENSRIPQETGSRRLARRGFYQAARGATTL